MVPRRASVPERTARRRHPDTLLSTTVALVVLTLGITACTPKPPPPPVTFSNVVPWTHAWDVANATTYLDRGTTRVATVSDTGSASTLRPAVRDKGFYGASLGLDALPGPMHQASDAQFGGRPSFAPDAVGWLWSMLSPNVNPTRSSDWFDAPNGIAAPYWIAVLGNLGPTTAAAGAVDAQQGDAGTCPTIGAGNLDRQSWSISTFGPAPFAWPSIQKPLVANETYLMLARVASGTGASFLEINWRDASGTVRQVRRDVTLNPYACKELFFGLVHPGAVSAAGLARGQPSSAQLAAVRSWAAPFLPAGTVATLPGAPIEVSAVAGDASATVSFTPPASDGGSPITSYTVTSSPGNHTATGSASPIVIEGLTNDTPTTFTVTATNAHGTGPASAPSNEVTPTAPPPDTS